MLTIERMKAVFMGHAVADALGVPIEFCSRAQLKAKPTTQMEGFGTYSVPAGAWSDDTSMSLCALEALATGGCDFDKIMTNFGKWLCDGEFTPTGKMFDVGITCSTAIKNYYIRKLPLEKCGQRDEGSNGNGSLMRIHPFALMAYCKNAPTAEWLKLIEEASGLTHAHKRSVLGCQIYGCILMRLLQNPAKASIQDALSWAEELFKDNSELTYYSRLFDKDFCKLSEDKIKSTGYVVHTLEAAVWCLLTTDSYKACVLKAVNLGEDTDTVGAIAGGLAGALYGYEGIPKAWLNALIKREELELTCDKAYACWIKN